jgi:hypothetical protein
LGQVFEERRVLHRSSVGQPHWFANLLPEVGSGLRRYYMAQWRDRHLDDARLLLALGEDLPGAVTVGQGRAADQGDPPGRTAGALARRIRPLNARVRPSSGATLSTSAVSG